MHAVNPTTGAFVHHHPESTYAELVALLEASHQAYLGWRRAPMGERAASMRLAAAILRERAAAYAELMAIEMGKPISEGVGEVNKCAWVCEYYADHAEHFLADEHITTDASKSYVTYQPLGVVLAIMPWNFPFWQVFRFAAPTLMAGNVGVLKHASNVPGCALAIEEVFRDAGFPASVFRTALVGSAQVAALIRHPRVTAVTLTGSTPAGRDVAQEAGRNLKKTVLELGGSDPYVILEDADLELAVDACVTSRLINAGQSCIAAKRFIVVDAVREAFEQKFVARMRAAVLGDPLATSTTIGPMARHDLRDDLHDQVIRSVAAGARLLLGGVIPDLGGAFYPPTVLSDVQPSMPAYDEEMFGPVAAIIPARDEADAIALANDTAFGLGAAVFTRDVARGERIAREELQAGCCFVNAFVRSDPRLPFGGIKESGYGRELARQGILEFVNPKTVTMA